MAVADLLPRWLAALQAYLPPGIAITREPGANMTRLLEGAAVQLAVAQDAAEAWTAQYDPLLATTMLADWERLLGLPDGCCPTAIQTLQQRRQAVLDKLVLQGGQSPAYYIAVCARMGIPVTITEFAPETFTWRINAPMVNLDWFKVGVSRAGDALRTWGDPCLECTINRLKPAHTRALFGYA